MLGVGQSARTKGFTMSLKKDRLKPVALWDCAGQRFTSQTSHDSVNPKRGLSQQHMHQEMVKRVISSSHAEVVLPNQ